MRGAEPKRGYTSARGVKRLRDQLSERDMAIIAQVSDRRLMSGRQIQAIHFPASVHVSELSATRTRQRVLMRLIRDGALSPLARRVGGIRAGSAGLVVGPGPLSGRVLGSQRRRRVYEPTSRFFDHTLAISQLVVDVSLAARAGKIESVEYESEPNCWRTFAGLAGKRLLRPDLFLALGVDGYELLWFCEIDRGTESLPTVLAKCRLYAEYYQAGIEQAKHQVFPRVCWIAPDETRAQRLGSAIAKGSFPERLFAVTTSERAVLTLASITPNK
jgi:hypothetical protein